MLCCGTFALAASFVLAVGRRVALPVLAGAGALIDPGPLLQHAIMICRGG